MSSIIILLGMFTCRSQPEELQRLYWSSSSCYKTWIFQDTILFCLLTEHVLCFSLNSWPSIELPHIYSKHSSLVFSNLRWSLVNSSGTMSDVCYPTTATSRSWMCHLVHCRVCVRLPFLSYLVGKSRFEIKEGTARKGLILILVF